MKRKRLELLPRELDVRIRSVCCITSNRKLSTNNLQDDYKEAMQSDYDALKNDWYNIGKDFKTIL